MATTRPRILTVQEAAEVTHLSVNTLAYYRQIGKGPKWARLGKRVFYRETDLQEWIDAQFSASAK